MVQAIERVVPRSWSVRLGSLLRPPVTCAASTTAVEAAATMTRERTPWLLVRGRDGLGIVTEQDLSARVLALGRDPRTPIGEIAGGLAEEIPSDRTAADVLLSMLESGARHVPVVDARRRLLGVVSDVDLVGLGWRSPLQLRSRIESATDVPGVAAAGLDLPRIVAGLIDEGADPIDVARMVTLVIDALTQRFIELAVQRLGAPPVPWAWMMLGSAARREQAAITDQDHALAFELNGEPLEQVDEYFLELATAVTSGLAAAGIPRCHADVVAENRSLRRPLDHWVTAFTDWMDDPRIESGRQASILFDQRRSAGPLEAERTLGAIIGSAPSKPRFIARLAKQAVDVPAPPIPARGFPFGSLRRGEWTFDVKRAGLTPIVNLARSYALEAGVTEAGTLRRLSGAAACGRIYEQSRGDLTEAFRLMWRIRLEHHARCVEGGRPVDDLIDGRFVGSLSRAHLAEAFKIIRHEQRSLRHRRAKT
jgi:CBS domain-containing protein